MELLEVLQQIYQDADKANMPVALTIGTVETESPLSVKVNGFMRAVPEQMLYLTEPVVEKKIPILEHLHTCPDGQTSKALLKTDIICMEYGKPLPVEKGYIILNRRLEVGDKVLMLRVQHGQKYVILSRVFEGGGS